MPEKSKVKPSERIEEIIRENNKCPLSYADHREEQIIATIQYLNEQWEASNGER